MEGTMKTWKQNAALRCAFETKDPKAVETFLRALSQSQWDDSFVLCGDYFLLASLADDARAPQTLSLISCIAPADAKNALETIGNSVGLPLHADADGIALHVITDCILPIRPQMRALFGTSLLCVAPEFQIAETVLNLMAGTTKDNIPHLYDIAALSQHYDLDGRVLYESLNVNQSRFSESGDDFLKPDWLAKCIYDHLLKPERGTMLGYDAALAICGELLAQVCADVRSEREFFGYWNATTGKWSNYRNAAGA